jgi:hypothetical protein
LYAHAERLPWTAGALYLDADLHAGHIRQLGTRLIGDGMNVAAASAFRHQVDDDPAPARLTDRSAAEYADAAPADRCRDGLGLGKRRHARLDLDHELIVPRQ